MRRCKKIVKNKKGSEWTNEKQQNFLEEFSTKLQFKSLDDWYGINNKLFIKHGGGSLLNKYSGNLFRILYKFYPKHPWNVFQRNSIPKKFWKSKENQKLFLDQLKVKLGLKTLDEWSQVNNMTIIQHGGGTIINKYNGRFILALQNLYPEHNWDLLSIKKTKNFWEFKKNRTNFLERIYEKFELNSLDDWYNIKQEIIKENGGSGLLKKFKGSLFKALKMDYPNYIWDISLTKCKGRWNEFNYKIFALKLQKYYLVNKKDDWYRISQVQVNSLFSNIHSLNIRSLSVMKILKTVYPKEHFNKYLLKARLKKSSQRRLWVAIQKLLINHHILEEYIHPTFRYKTGCNFRFDIYVPSILLALEYQGEQHFDDSPNVFSNIEVYQHRDEEKRESCDKRGIILISIPFWWSGSEERLANTVFLRVLEKYCNNNNNNYNNNNY